MYLSGKICKVEIYSDAHFMKLAYQEAEKAEARDEVPVGAIIVSDHQIIARGHNLTETLNDVTAHAEMQVITAAANTLGSKYLWDCTLYVTLEPCPMCAGALFWSQISRIVYAASDVKRGYRTVNSKMLHPKTKIESGLMEEEAAEILVNFFRKKR